MEGPTESQMEGWLKEGIGLDEALDEGMDGQIG